MTHLDILNFWLKETAPEDRFQVKESLDKEITERFSDTLQKAIAGELYEWRDEPSGRLAEIIVLDQFSRNIFRGTPKAFSQDPQALVLAQEAVRLGIDKNFSPEEKQFLYMPYMHSESPLIHQIALQLYSSDPNLKEALTYEVAHKEIIDHFGRYPHRNEILDRESRAEEKAFLKEENSSF